VLEDVGERLLDHAVRRELGRAAEADPGPFLVEVHGQPAGGDLVEENRKLGEGRLRGHPVEGPFGVQGRQQLTHAAHRLLPGARHRLQDRHGHRGVLLGHHPAALGLADHDREGVRDDVVHLPGEPGPLLVEHLAGMTLTVLLLQLGALLQRRHVRRPHPAEPAQAPRRHRSPGHRQHQEQRPAAHRGVGLEVPQPSQGDRRPHDRDAEGQQRAPRRAARGDGVERHREQQCAGQHDRWDGTAVLRCRGGLQVGREHGQQHHHADDGEGHEGHDASYGHDEVTGGQHQHAGDPAGVRPPTVGHRHHARGKYQGGEHGGEHGVGDLRPTPHPRVDRGESLRTLHHVTVGSTPGRERRRRA
jgi:hypothetical protein